MGWKWPDGRGGPQAWQAWAKAAAAGGAAAGSPAPR